MTVDLTLTCAHCGEATLADDEFCERCGASQAERHRRWDHVELDEGSVAGVSDRGLVHQRNEDALFVGFGDGRAVVVVCDGVSTARAPDQAAQVAAAAAGEHLDAGPDAQDQAEPSEREAHAADRAVRAVTAADDAVRSIPWQPSADRDAPACTIVAALWDGTSVTIAWAGDSRAYWLGVDAAQCLTLDHSWAQDQIAAGRLTVDEAQADTRAHAITRWLGDDAPDDPVAVTAYRPTTSGRLVLCTDGLWNHAPSSDEMAALIAELPSDAPPIDVARTLTRTAIARGGHDNITVGVIDIPGRVAEPEAMR